MAAQLVGISSQGISEDEPGASVWVMYGDSRCDWEQHGEEL